MSSCLFLGWNISPATIFLSRMLSTGNYKTNCSTYSFTIFCRMSPSPLHFLHIIFPMLHYARRQYPIERDRLFFFSLSIVFSFSSFDRLFPPPSIVFSFFLLNHLFPIRVRILAAIRIFFIPSGLRLWSLLIVTWDTWRPNPIASIAENFGRNYHSVVVGWKQFGHTLISFGCCCRAQSQ